MARERLDSLLALHELHVRYGHLQEIIIQNFLAKPGTPMNAHPEPALDDLVRTAALARLVFPATVSIQVPPNLNRDLHGPILDAGIDD
jgi:FO synthase